MTGAVELQVAALLERVHRVRDETIGTLRAEGARSAEAVLAAARRDARRLVRTAAREKRERVRDRCRRALADVDASQRRSEFEAERRAVEAALALLPGALERRWRDPDARRRWCLNAVQLAAARLVARDWTIAFAGEPGVAERAALDARVASAGARATFVPGAARAGLVISAAASRVDATVDGLTGDREAIAARLLALAPGGAP